jgi:uncharacterized protein (DUF433 family)
MATIDWAACDAVERVEGKVSGLPVVIGTRVLADAAIEDAASGSDMNELRENYPAVPEQTMTELLTFARTHKLQPQP